jgi:pilus assembly protein Flp/PilA
MPTRRTLGDESGASAVEYGLIIAAIAAVTVIILFALGGVVRDLFTESCTTIANEASPTSSCAP